jgi:hypothetical protein
MGSDRMAQILKKDIFKPFYGEGTPTARRSPRPASTWSTVQGGDAGEGRPSAGWADEVGRWGVPMDRQYTAMRSTQGAGLRSGRLVALGYCLSNGTTISRHLYEFSRCPLPVVRFAKHRPGPRRGAYRRE